ncbi:hypothetical protein D3C86_1742710 [compost metagenome]
MEAAEPCVDWFRNYEVCLNRWNFLRQKSERDRRRFVIFFCDVHSDRINVSGGYVNHILNNFGFSAAQCLHHRPFEWSNDAVGLPDGNRN